MRNPRQSIFKFIRQFREAFALTKSTNFRFLRSFPPGHFYSPIPDYEEIDERSSLLFDQQVKRIPGIDLQENQQLQLIETFKQFYREIPWPAADQVLKYRYHFDNNYFSYGDAISLYSMMRYHRPKRIFEIGSGYSSAAMLDVDQFFFNSDIEFTFIEPHTERLRAQLTDADLKRMSMLELPVQRVDLSEFEKLEDGDFLFIDSSHISKTGSDVNYLIHQVLPLLSSGVIIHFHDILWPFEYPKKWVRSGRSWNEAYLVRAFLQYNPSFEILFFNSFLEHHHRDQLREKLPLMLRQPSSKMTLGNSSLWIRKNKLGRVSLK